MVKPSEPSGGPRLLLVEQWPEPAVLQLQRLQGWIAGEPEERMEEDQRNPHRGGGGAHLGLCHCLQCFQKCPNWRPFPAIQTRLGLILEPHSPYFSDAGSWPFFLKKKKNFSTSFLSIQWWKCIVVYSVYIPLCFTHLQGRCGGMDQRHVYLYIILPVVVGSISIIQLSWESDSSSIFTECFGTLWIE